MFHISNRKDKNQEDYILVYIESFDRKAGIVLLDFMSSNDYNLFNIYANINYNFYERVRPSMVLLENYRLRRIQENTYYKINQSTIENWGINQLIKVENDSYLLGYSVNVNSIQDSEIFVESVSFSQLEQDFFMNRRFIESGYSANFEKIEFQGSLSVIVKNVGQGSWNEVKSDGKTVVVYDMGTHLHATKKEIRQLIDNHIDDYLNTKPDLIISHWDNDHYSILLGMSDDELQCFNCFVCRDACPNLTSIVFCNKMKELLDNVRICLLQAERKLQPDPHPKFLKPLTPVGSNLMIYNGQENKDRNVSGIVISVHSEKTSVVLAADAHYEQINKYILPTLNKPHSHYLVVPHHGGKAGKFEYLLSPYVKTQLAIISVGKNIYGHPLEENITSLRSIGFTVKRTNFSLKDIEIQL